MRNLKTGDPCPCCGLPVTLTDPEALRLLGMVADMMGLPDAPRAPSCGRCSKADKKVYMSYPAKYRCTITAEYHEADHVCEMTPAERYALEKSMLRTI